MAGEGDHWSHQTTFAASPISASQARAFVSRHLTDHRLPNLVDPVQLVASELATNAVLHAQTAFSVSLAASDQTVLLTVHDDSPALPTRPVAQATDPSGRGLEIVGIVTRDWGIHQDAAGSKAVWACFAIEEEVLGPPR